MLERGESCCYLELNFYANMAASSMEDLSWSNLSKAKKTLASVERVACGFC